MTRMKRTLTVCAAAAALVCGPAAPASAGDNHVAVGPQGGAPAAVTAAAGGVQAP